MIKKRRKLLQILLALPFANRVGAFSEKANTINETLFRELHQQDVLMEIHSVYLEWISAGLPSPQQFLSECGLTQPRKKGSLRHYIKNDFIDQKTIMINGLVLSKTEAAFIASLGEKICIFDGKYLWDRQCL